MSEPQKPEGNSEKSPFDMGTVFGPKKYDPVKPGQIAGDRDNSQPRQSVMADELAQLERTLMSGEVSPSEKRRIAERIQTLRRTAGLERNQKSDNSSETLVDVEDRLRREIDELKQKGAATKDADERVRIDNAIQGKLAGLETIQSEMGTRLREEKIEETHFTYSVQNALSKWLFSSSCVDTLTNLASRCKYFQIQSANRIIPLTPEMVMLMLLIRGCLHKENPENLAAILAKAFSLRYKNLEQALAERLSSSSNAAELSISIISPRLEEVFDFAENISRRVSGKLRISQRHLIAALLYGNNNSKNRKSGLELPASVFRPSEFVWELEKYVKASPTVCSKELPQEWEKVVAEIKQRIPQKSFDDTISTKETVAVSPEPGIHLPETTVRLASEIRALEEKGVNTTDTAERVQIKAELDQKYVELAALLAERPEELNLRAWDAEFATLRHDSGFRWSTTLDRVLDLLWEEHSRAFKESLGNKRRRFEPQISPRAFFLASMLYGARHQGDLRDRADDRGQTLIRVVLAADLSEEQINQLLTQEFFRQMPPEPVSRDRAVVSANLEAVIRRADALRRKFGSDPYIGTRHLFLAFLEAPEGGKPGDLIIRSQDGLQLSRLISAFRDSVIDKPWVKKYDTAVNWSQTLDELEARLPNESNISLARRTSGFTSGVSRLNFGGTDSFEREASSRQSCMKVQAYAGALRDFFSRAGPGELCFALYGHWGRGKTYLEAVSKFI